VLQVKKSFVPDYYAVIKNPRDLGTIKKNLIRKKYETPQEFYEVRVPAGGCAAALPSLACVTLKWRVCRPRVTQAAAPVRMLPGRHMSACQLKAVQTVVPAAQDMHLFFSNIYTYNGTNSNFGKLGSRVEGLFEVSTTRACCPATRRCCGNTRLPSAVLSLGCVHSRRSTGCRCLPPAAAWRVLMLWRVMTL